MKVYIVVDSDGVVHGVYRNPKKAQKAAMVIYSKGSFENPIVVSRKVR